MSQSRVWPVSVFPPFFCFSPWVWILLPNTATSGAFTCLLRGFPHSWWDKSRTNPADRHITQCLTQGAEVSQLIPAEMILTNMFSTSVVIKNTAVPKDWETDSHLALVLLAQRSSCCYLFYYNYMYWRPFFFLSISIYLSSNLKLMLPSIHPIMFALNSPIFQSNHQSICWFMHALHPSCSFSFHPELSSHHITHPSFNLSHNPCSPSTSHKAIQSQYTFWNFFSKI